MAIVLAGGGINRLLWSCSGRSFATATLPGVPHKHPITIAATASITVTSAADRNPIPFAGAADTGGYGGLSSVAAESHDITERPLRIPYLWLRERRGNLVYCSLARRQGDI